MERGLHIISLDIPYPVRHGGLTDIYHKLVALHTAGVRIVLHCFHRGLPEQPELLQFCEEVYYYRRKENPRFLFSALPAMVTTRSADMLYTRLQLDNWPILLEGWQTSFVLDDPTLASRRIFLRLHNVEHRYYRGLARSVPFSPRKAFYLLESLKLQRYERRLSGRPEWIFAVAERDLAEYRRLYPAARISYLPVFTGDMPVSIGEGLGTYCLYHGNLSIAENEIAVRWLVEQVFPAGQLPLVVAGRMPAPSLQRLLRRKSFVELVANPDEETMDRLIREAQLHVLPAWNDTGVKLKLIRALHQGRHCIVNTPAVHGSALEPLCHVADGPLAFRSVIQSLSAVPVPEEERLLRAGKLKSWFDDRKLAAEMLQIIFPPRTPGETRPGVEP